MLLIRHTMLRNPRSQMSQISFILKARDLKERHPVGRLFTLETPAEAELEFGASKRAIRSLNPLHRSDRNFKRSQLIP